jgi:hypothetical protein
MTNELRAATFRLDTPYVTVCGAQPLFIVALPVHPGADQKGRSDMNDSARLVEIAQALGLDPGASQQEILDGIAALQDAQDAAGRSGRPQKSNTSAARRGTDIEERCWAREWSVNAVGADGRHAQDGFAGDRDAFFAFKRAEARGTVTICGRKY